MATLKINEFFREICLGAVKNIKYASNTIAKISDNIVTKRNRWNKGKTNQTNGKEIKVANATFINIFLEILLILQNTAATITSKKIV